MCFPLSHLAFDALYTFMHPFGGVLVMQLFFIRKKIKKIESLELQTEGLAFVVPRWACVLFFL